MSNPVTVTLCLQVKLTGEKDACIYHYYLSRVTSVFDGIKAESAWDNDFKLHTFSGNNSCMQFIFSVTTVERKLTKVISAIKYHVYSKFDAANITLTGSHEI